GTPKSPGESADRPTHIAVRRRNTRRMPQTLCTTAISDIDTVRPSIWSRIGVRLGARHFDCLVLAGARPQPGSALEVHMERLASRGHRELLAGELRRRGTAVLCDRVMSALPARKNTPAVWDAADLIERVEKRLLAR